MTNDAEDSTKPSPPGSKLHAEVERAIGTVRQELQKPRLEPVKRKVFMMIYDRLSILQASLLKPATEWDDRDERLNERILEILKLLDRSMSEEAAWDVADSLKELLPEVAPAEYVYWALVEEKRREAGWSDNWDKYFSAEELKESILTYEENPKKFNTQGASDRLVALYRIRNGEGRHHRAREGARWNYLRWISLLLFFSAVALVFSWHFASNSPSQSLLEMRIVVESGYPELQVDIWSGWQPLMQMLVVFLAGAVGAVLSGTIRLRDLPRILELQAAWKTLIPQMILGATLATVVVLILKTGLIKVANLDFESPDTSLLFVVGLVSGFSEPFALGLLEKVAALGQGEGTP